MIRAPQHNGHVLCARHDAALKRAVREVMDDWFGERTIRGMTPVSEGVWGEFLREMERREAEMERRYREMRERERREEEGWRLSRGLGGQGDETQRAL